MNISGVWIPIVAMLIPIVAIISGSVSEMHKRRLEMEQRMALIARGVPLAEIDALMKTPVSELGSSAKDPMRSLGNSRRAAAVLISVGIGLIVFFLALDAILRVREVLAGAAAGVIPVMIGIGFVVDYFLQKRELKRFGLEINGNNG
jgi:hypothetical protein